MNRLIRTLFVCLCAVSISGFAFANKPVKVKVIQDAFVQGGDFASEALGQTNPERLRVMKSDGDDKYSRTTFLQFSLKKVDITDNVTLNLCVRTYPSKNDPTAQFTLGVYSCSNNKWYESNITYENQPEKGELLATSKLSVSKDNKWIQVTLPAEKLKALKKQSKKGKVTLVLYNSSEDFNRTSIEVISKERKWSNGSLAKREAYLEIG